MNLLKSVESTIANLVEGTFGRMFRSEVRPMELARKLAREMDEHRTTSVSRVYAPNDYLVWLSPPDRARYEGIEEEVIDELCAYLLEHARREELILASPPHIVFNTDERLRIGEFGIQAQLVHLAAHTDEGEQPGLSAGRTRPGPGGQPQAGEEHGQTMIYSSSARVRGPLEEANARRAPARARLIVAGRRLLLPVAGGVLGRSRDCDVVLEDSGVSRHHAQIVPSGEGWAIEDLQSTNGVLVNGHPLRGAQLLRAGDRLELGSTEIVFEVG